MGLLKNAIKNGISQSISKAVEDAAKSVVAPVVNKAAEAVSAKVSEVATEANKTMEQAKQDLAEASANAKEAAVNLEEANKAAEANNVDLNSILTGFMSNANSFVNSVATNFKECPKCGETIPADAEFCPSCGTKVEKGSYADALTCSVCGTVNVFDATFCAKCGGKLNGTVAKEQSVLKNWKEKLAVYPEWACEGSCVEICDLDEVNGHPAYQLRVEHTDESTGRKYIQQCVEAGFTSPKNRDYLAYKMIDGLPCTASCYDGFYDGVTEITFYIADEEEYKEDDTSTNKKTTISSLYSDNKETIDKAAEAAKDVAKEAGKLLSGLFSKK